MAFDAKYAGSIDPPFFEIGDQGVAGGVLSHGGDGKNARAERGEIVRGVGTATGHELGFAMAQDQDRRFAGDAGDFAELEFVGNEVAEDGHRPAGKLLDVFGESQEIDGSRSRRGLRLGTLHFACLRIQSTAAARSSATKSGCLGQAELFSRKSSSP